MITIQKYRFGGAYELKGLSTDIKPVDHIGVNSLFLELDTGLFYYFDGTAWNRVGAVEPDEPEVDGTPEEVD